MYSNAIIDFSNFDKTTLFAATLYLICYFIIYWIVYITFAKQIKNGTDLRIKSKSMLALIGAGVLINIVISSIITYYLREDSLGSAINYATNTLCGILLLASQFGQLSTKEAKRELDILQNLWLQEKEQYQILQENMDLINIKCHDFRHKIRDLGGERSVDKETIDEMQQLISFYDAEISTGNKTIDIILTEKSLTCREKNIDFTCIVNGKILDFMKEGDLYALLGNILDNAVEAVDPIKDKTKRCINFVVEEKQNTILIREDNYFIGDSLKMKDGLPITTKGDTSYHGYGLKSIREIVSRYDGVMRVDTSKDIFQLSIVIFR